MPISNQGTVQLDKRITFTPLARNRFRCNWNGEVISKKAVQAARQNRWEYLRSLDKKPSAKKTQWYPYYTGAMYGSSDCPYCKRFINNVKLGPNDCPNCEKKFVTER